MTDNHNKHNRRSFLKVSGAAGGGLLLGFNFFSCRTDGLPDEVAKLVLPEEWFEINNFLKIGDNGVVTIFSPNPEIGQNIKTSMPMIVAEELDVDWNSVVVEQAGLDTQKYTRQVAGGSQSIRQGWESLRKAGATARRLLLEAASKRWELPVAELTTEAGVISHAASGQTIGYGEVASEAATMKVPEDIPLKDPKDFKIIGKGKKNVDGRGIVTGAPLFGMDYEEEGMLIAMVEQPPAFGATLISFNKDELKSMPGITDAMELKLDLIPEGKWFSKAYRKKSMIAITGETTWQVMKAKKAIKAEWETKTDPENSELHEEQLTVLLDKNPKPLRKDGSPESAFDNATTVIERTYSAPFLPHNTMAPMNFFADVKAESARLVGPIQTPEISAGILAEGLGLPLENVSIEMTRMGGGFGRRLYGNWLYEAALISKAMAKPVKLIYTREDDMANGTYRPTYKVRYKAALNENNELLALTVKGAGADGGPIWPNRFPAGTVPHYAASDSAMETNISTGAWRAPRSNFIAGAEQSFLDELAEAAGKDPIDFRLALFEKAKTNPVGEENDYDPERYAGVLKLVREKAGWDKPSPGLHRGVAAYYCHNSYVAQVVDLENINGNLKVKKVWCAVDCGIVINPEGARNQIEGGVVDGLGIAMFGGLSFKDGKPEQTNFNRYQMIRMGDAPVEIETFFVENGIDPTGLGEPGLPPVIGALANALHKATGQRHYDQPFSAMSEKVG